MKTFKNTQAYYKDPNTGEFKSFNVLGDNGDYVTREEYESLVEEVENLKATLVDGNEVEY